MICRDYPPEAYRKLKSRWIITANLKITTAGQIGSHAADTCDQTFEVNEDGNPVLRGSTLAGALRTALSDYLSGFRKDEDNAIKKLFGNVGSNGDNGNESIVIVFDSAAKTPNIVLHDNVRKTLKTAIRDGVRINLQTGLADDGKKYDRELTLPGVEFPIRLELVIPENTEWISESDVIEYIRIALTGLTDGSIAFGARKSRGLGACCASDFKARRFDLTTQEGWLDFAQTDHLTPLKEIIEGVSKPALALEAAWDKAKNQVSPEDKRDGLTLTFQLDNAASLLIRSPGQTYRSTDVVHLRENDKNILSGTSMAGRWRSYAHRIVNTLGISGGDEIVSDLFGTAPEMMKDNPKASRIYFSESVVVESKTHIQSRVKIDRLTGGAIDTALFDEEPALGGKIEHIVIVRNPTKADIALVLLTARDLSQGLLTVGGGASIGRGVLKGTLVAKRKSLREEWECQMDANGAITGIDSVVLDGFINALIGKEASSK